MAGAYKIAGFSLMVPLGQIVLSIPNIVWSSLDVKYVSYIVTALVLFCFGIILVLEGAKILRRKEEKS